MVLCKDKMVEPEFAIYCDFRDSMDYVKLSFIRNEELNRGNEGLEIKELLGLSAVVGNDTLKSNTNTIAIPKKLFTGQIQLIKHVSALYKGELGVLTPSLIIIAEELLKYGSVEKQAILIHAGCMQ